MKSTNQRDHCEWGDLHPPSPPFQQAALFWFRTMSIWVSGQKVTIPGEQQAVMIFFFLFLKSLMVHSVSSVCEFMCPVVSGVKSTMLVLWALGRGVQSGCWYCHTMNYSTVSRYHCLSAASSLVVLPIKNTHNCPLLAGINHCTCMNNTCGADKWNVITVSQKFLSQNRDIRFCSWWF